MSGNDVRPFAQLTDAEVDQGTAALLAALGEQPDAKMQRRLGLRRDGAWCLALRSVRPSSSPDPKHRDAIFGIWAQQVVQTFHPLVEALALLDAGAEAKADEIEDRIAAHHAESERLEKERIETTRRDELDRQRREREHNEKAAKYQWDTWYKTPEWAQLLLWQAIIWAPTRPDEACRFRQLAEQGIGRAGRMGAPGHLPPPERVWR